MTQGAPQPRDADPGADPPLSHDRVEPVLSEPMSDPRLRVLVLCTANVCRSPITAMMLDRELLARGVNAVVDSAGFLDSGAAPCVNMATFGSEKGFDLSFHHSRRLDEWLVQSATVVLTMERRHAREAIMDYGAPPARVHTIGGFLGLARDRPPVDESLEEWLVRNANARPIAALLARDGEDEIPDPHGQSRRVHRKAFEQFERVCGELADVLASMAKIRA